jgi:TP901 family phage tail tape measure protein
MDLGQASDFVTDGLTALGYEAEDAADFVNILAAASTSSNTSVAQMQKAFTNCAPVAGTLGITMEDLSIALGLIADKGVKGAKAGTALKNLMANLSAPTEKQLSYIRKFNLEGAQQAIVEGRLVDGIKQMQQALSGLDPKQKNAIITTIAGKEALSGVSALLNTTEGDLAELEGAIRNCDGAAKEMADTMDLTLKGHLKELASAMQETVLQVFDKTEKGLKDFTKQLTEFFHILNGFSDFGGFKGLEGALAFLENASQGWSTAITNGLTQAMGAIDDFVNGGALESLLNVGTNIIDGIANGIRNAAENGTLQNAITGAIEKIGTWFSENLDTVIEVGKLIIDAITKGISENQDLIHEVINQVIDMQNTIDSTVAYEKARLFGENFISFFCKGAESKLNEWSSTLGGFLNGLFGGSSSVYGSGFRISDSITGAGQWYNTGMNAGNDYNKGISDSTKKNNVTNEVVNQMNKGKVNTDTAAAEIGQGISDNILKKLETMDAGALKELRQELEGLQKTTSTVSESMGKSFGLIRESARTEIVGMANIFRNQFINMTNITRNQMINVSNIIRNQAINWANIIRNQITNSRNAFTSQMMSMASVARTQMVNISNIIRNQSVNWANIIGNQAKNARDNLTRQFMSMAAVVKTQMNKCLSSVKSTMSQIAKQTNKSMNLKVNVNKTVTTKNATASSTPSMASAFYAANTASAFSMGTYANTSTLSSRASSAISSGGSSSSYTGSNRDLLLEIPLVVDGRELARSSAKYINGELKAISKRNDRKRGIK